MKRKLLSAEEIKINVKLRKLIKEFLSSDMEDPKEVLDHISGSIDCKVIAIAELSESDRKKLRDMKEDEQVSFDMNLRLIEDDDGDSWIPVFTSEETAKEAGNDDSEKISDDDLLPLSLFDVMDQIKDDDEVSGLVIDPWTSAFPLPREVISDIMDDEDGPKGGINLIKGNIEDLDCDAIVNSSNNTLVPEESGVNGSIHKAAGAGLAQECATLHGCKTGEAKITDSYDLDCKYVIHTVGPIYSGKKSDDDLLASCYDNSLYLAREHGLHQIAFPCISTGKYGFPKEDALDIAVQTVLEWMVDNDDYEMGVIFCCHDENDFNMYQDYLNEELGDPDEDE